MNKLKHCFHKSILEVGVDEVARGCLAGPVFAAAVIWNPFLKNYCNINIPNIRDSKKMTIVEREECDVFIKKHALDWAIASVDVETIDKINIRNSAMLAMHNAIDKLNVRPDHILADGNYFKEYIWKKEIGNSANHNSETSNTSVIPYTTVIKGDNEYLSIACASIIAKVARDKHMLNLIKEDESLKKYKWENNKGYGTKEHIELIKKHGISIHHRKTFGICKKLHNKN